MPELKRIRIREATPRDRGLFKKLWKKFLAESYEKGDVVLPTDSNVEFYASLFDQYTNPNVDFNGVVLFVADVAVLMFGDDGSPLELSIGNHIAGWGLYVEPEHRRKGISTLLYKAAFEKSKELGFEVMLGGYLRDNPDAKGALAKATEDGFQELTTSIFYELPDAVDEE
jgi:GNAT superfamily N-acetyltransferase